MESALYVLSTLLSQWPTIAIAVIGVVLGIRGIGNSVANRLLIIGGILPIAVTISITAFNALIHSLRDAGYPLSDLMQWSIVMGYVNQSLSAGALVMLLAATLVSRAEYQTTDIQATNAGFGWRVLASLIDALILGVALFTLWLILKTFVSFANAAITSWLVAALLSGWLYSAAFESSAMMATPGKYLLGLRTSTIFGQRMSFGRATARAFTRMGSAGPLGIGYLVMLALPSKQTFYELATQTVVRHIEPAIQPQTSSSV